MDPARPTSGSSVRQTTRAHKHESKTFTVGHNFTAEWANLNFCDHNGSRQYRELPDHPLATGDGHP